MRNKWRRTWIKLYPVDCLDGSIRYQLKSDERGVWYDLLNFAAICANAGTISDKDDRAFPHSFVANRLNVPLALLERTLEKCNEEGRTKEDEQGIRIVNWAAYQSEYERQKPYRERAKAERGAKTDYTRDMFWEDWNEIFKRYKEKAWPFEPRGDSWLEIFSCGTVVFFAEKYGDQSSINYGHRFGFINLFLIEHSDALKKMGLFSHDTAIGRATVDDELIDVLLDSFSLPKPEDSFPVSSLGTGLLLDFDKVIKALKEAKEKQGSLEMEE